MSTLTEKIKEFLRDCSVNWECDTTGYQEFEQHRPKFCRACQAKELLVELDSASTTPTYAQGQELSDLLAEVQRMCNKIVNSPPDTTIKGDIESLAFTIGHHPFILRALPIKEGE